MKRFVCLMKPIVEPRTDTDHAQTFKLHGAFLSDMAKKGSLIFAGYTTGENPGSLSLAVFTSSDATSAQGFADAAPAVKAGLLSAEIIPFEVFISREV